MVGRKREKNQSRGVARDRKNNDFTNSLIDEQTKPLPAVVPGKLRHFQAEVGVWTRFPKGSHRTLFLPQPVVGLPGEQLRLAPCFVSACGIETRSQRENEMANLWHCKRQDKQFGPFSDQQLKQLAASGKLQPSDMVQREGTDQWVPANRLKGLFPTAVAKPLAMGTPSPDTPPPLPPDDSDTPPPMPSNEQETGVDIESLTGSAPSPTSSASSSTSPHVQTTKGKAKELFGSLASRGKAAGLLIAKQTERTKLLKATLPGHYHALGNHLHAERSYLDEFPANFQVIDALLEQIKAVEARSANSPKAEGFAAKATAAAKATQDMVQAKALKMKLAGALAELGQTAYDSHGEESGPEELVRPIANAKSRADQLATEIAQLSKAPAGQIFTPKRIAIGAVVLVGLILVGIIGNVANKEGSGGSKSSHGGNGGWNPSDEYGDTVEKDGVEYWANGNKKEETLENEVIGVETVPLGTGSMPVQLHPTIVYYENGKKAAKYYQDPRDDRYHPKFWDEQGNPISQDAYCRRWYGKTWSDDYGNNLRRRADALERQSHR